MNRFALILAIATASAAFAGPWEPYTHGAGYNAGRVKYYNNLGYSAGSGGEFTIEGMDSNHLLQLNLGAYAASTKNRRAGTGNDFQTFCIEKTEYLDNPMGGWVSTENTNGGAGSHAWYGGTGAPDGNGDDLDARTAYVYERFARGGLAGYAYSGTVGGLSRPQTARALQSLIWTFEGENSLYGDLDSNTTIRNAQIALINRWKAAADAWASGGGGLRGVRVLQLAALQDNSPWGPVGLGQDQLYLTVPIPGAALLGALGLGIAGWAKRRMA